METTGTATIHCKKLRRFIGAFLPFIPFGHCSEYEHEYETNNNDTE